MCMQDDSVGAWGESETSHLPPYLAPWSPYMTQVVGLRPAPWELPRHWL